MLTIQFYYPKRFSFSPLDFESGVGGTESSIILLSKALTQLGNKVEVYNACWKPGVYDGVVWKGAWDIDKATAPDVFVCVRTKSSVIARQAKLHLFWMLDDRTDGVLEFHRKYPDGIVILASEVMRQRVLKAGYQGRIEKIYLPVDADCIVNDNKPSSSRIVLHSSMPNRGLRQLLSIWSSIIKHIPTAKLYITSGWELWGYTTEEAKDKWKQVIGTDYDLDGVIFTGVLPRSKYCELIKQIRFAIIPSCFPEMFCISAAEIEIAGKPLIVSDYEALRERVNNEENGFSIVGDINTQTVQNEFASRIVQLLYDDQLVDMMGQNSRTRGMRYHMRRIAREWMDLICNRDYVN